MPSNRLSVALQCIASDTKCIECVPNIFPTDVNLYERDVASAMYAALYMNMKRYMKSLIVEHRPPLTKRE